MFIPQLVKSHASPVYSSLSDMIILNPEDHTAVKFLLTSFPYLDIMASVSLRAKRCLDLNHEFLLEGNCIQLDQLFGCENWALLLLSKINELDTWKMECEKNGKLSIAELAKRASKIEDELEVRLDKIPLRDGDQSQKPSSRTHIDDNTSSELTRIFALSGLTYLHIVVSGPHPDLPEIVASVSRTVHAFEKLSNKDLLPNMVWPFCVTGCMVSEDKQDVFRALISAGSTQQAAFGTFRRACEIVEKCWKTRTTGTTCEWSSVMESMGQQILLV